MKKFLPTLLLCLAVVLTSCQTSAQERADINVSDFSAIKVSSGIDVYLSQTGTESVSIEADEDLMEDIIVKVEQHTLILRIDRNFMDWFSSRAPIKAYISFKDLDKIEVSSGSDLFGQGDLTFKDLKMTASGGSDIKMTLN